MRATLLLAALVLSSCTGTAVPDAGIALASQDASTQLATPDTSGREGHGGIELHPPSRPVPADLDGQPIGGAGPDCEPYSTPDGKLQFNCPDGGSIVYRASPIDEAKASDLYRRGLLIKDKSPMLAADLLSEALQHMDPRTEQYARTQALLKELRDRP